MSVEIAINFPAAISFFSLKSKSKLSEPSTSAAFNTFPPGFVNTISQLYSPSGSSSDRGNENNLNSGIFDTSQFFKMATGLSLSELKVGK